MKIFGALLFVLAVSSCQTNSVPGTLPGVAAEPSATAAPPVKVENPRNEQIRSEKKQQSLLDLPYRGFDNDKKLTLIATGSCSDQDQPQPIWKTIEKNAPDLFVFLGDTVYSSISEQKPISAQFKKMNFIYEYRDARLKMPFMAIWDDHDYGQNDGGVDNPEKEIYRAEFVKYWRYLGQLLPADQKALYHSKTFGTKNSKVQIIMLDTRWDRSPLMRNAEDSYNAENPEPGTFPRPYLPTDDKAARILSEAQWKWLESELKEPANVRLLVSSIQVIANDHNFEKWGNFPHERERLFNLLKKTKAKNTVILSGDRHMAAIAKTDMPGFPIYEMTSSALNRPARATGLMPDASYLGEPYGLVNFGLVRIDWDKSKLLLEVRSLADELKNSAEIKF